MSEIMNGLEEALRNDPEFGPRLQAIESIDKEVSKCVDFVDLGIAFSPVILDGGCELPDAVDVAYKGADGRYVIREPFRILSEEQMKLARARYLVVRGRAMKPALDLLFGKKTK
jgi:hypothetical protein